MSSVLAVGVLLCGLAIPPTRSAGQEGEDSSTPSSTASREFVPREVSFVMYDDPPTKSAKVIPPRDSGLVDPRLVDLWIKGLRHDEEDLRRQLAHIIRVAHREGMPNTKETFPELIKLLQLETLRESTRLEVVATIIELDPQAALAELRSEAEREGMEMAALVEPVLGRLQDRRIRDIWLKRLDKPERNRRLLLLALEGLKKAEDSRAVGRLSELVADRFLPPDVRFAAASALGKCAAGASDGERADALARSLSRDSSATGMIERLLAARIASERNGEEARQLLVRLSEDPEPTVAAICFRRLLEWDPAAVVEVARTAIERRDSNLRLLAAQVLGTQPTGVSIALLGQRLNDVHPEIRNFARRKLIELANDTAWEQQIRQIGMEMLQDESWQGIEQAILLLAALKHEEAVEGFVAQLEHARSEVYITAAWGIRVLDLPQVAAPVLAFAGPRVETLRQTDNPDLDTQLALLFEYLGRRRYQQADELLRAHIPKDARRVNSRAAAVWALGWLHKGEPVSEITTALEERIADVFSMVPERTSVRHMSAVAIARMGDKSALPTLRQYGPDVKIEIPVDYALAWAIHQLTGEPIPPVNEIHQHFGNWLLEPVQGSQ